MKNVFLIVLVLTSVSIYKVNAQVNLIDPSFEADYTYNVATTDRWVICNGSPDKWFADQFDWMSNPDPSDGLKYLGMVTPPSVDSDLYESISNNLTETLLQGEAYYFDFDLTYIFDPPSLWNDYGKVDIYLGNGACDLSQKIASCIAQDTIWETRRIQFTPDANYTSLTLRTESVDSMTSNYVLIDNFSSIFYSDDLSTSHDLQSSHIQVSSIIGTKRFSINLASLDADRFSFCIHSCNGRVLWEDIHLDLGLNIFGMDNVPSGIYFVVIKDSLTGTNGVHAISSM